jgi:adenine-specific DNA-methyltransferase
MAELIWDGKYDKEGRKVPPLRVALPFQTVETVNESAADRRRSLSLFSEGKSGDWRNRLIWGDKKYVLPSLLPQFAGKVDLIYIDPPFDTGADFSYRAAVPDLPETEEDESASFVKEPSIIEQKAYRDTWGVGPEGRTKGVTSLDRYLKWFCDTVVFLRELLSDTGSVYVHFDWHVGHYAKAVLDEELGPDRFRNEICWKRATAGSAKVRAKRFGSDHDVIYYYAHGQTAFNPVYAQYPEEEIKKRFRQRDTRGPYKDAELGTYSEETLDRLKAEDRLIVTKTGKYRYKIYLHEIQGVLVDSVWTDIPIVNSQAKERVNFPTQKPEALLERIIAASSSEGDLVLDCFCGSGTTPVVAEKLGRRWIACDLSRFAVHITRKRLLGVEGVKPFVVQNLGKYERQAWQVGEFGGGDGPEEAAARQGDYTRFILDLYHARPVTGYTWLHGVRAGRMVHVGSVDAPVSTSDLANIATEFRQAIGTGENAPTRNGVDVLGWDFAFDMNEIGKQQAAAANINVRFLRIPHDVMDKRAVEQGDVKFFELAALSVDVEQKARTVTLTLTDFVIPPDDVPEDVRKAVKHWEQWIDYWAVDWDNQGDTFHNEWQSYRTRKDKTLAKQVTHAYEAPGEYAIVVKVIDILGNDTTKTLKVKVK